MIERGSASVWRGHGHLGDLDRGDFFGELALLEGRARAATVVAATAMRLGVVPQREWSRGASSRA